MNRPPLAPRGGTDRSEAGPAERGREARDGSRSRGFPNVRNPAIPAATRRRWVRDRPELLLVPLAALLLGLNVGPWGFGPNYVVTFALFFTLQRSNAIFPITWTFSVALFASTWWLFSRRTSLPFWRAFLLAGTLPFLAVALFEIPCDLNYWAAYPNGGTTVFDLVSIGTWLAVGLTSIGWWKVTRGFWAYLGAFVAGFVLWLAIGFPTIDTARGSMLVVAYAFNVVLKIACFPLAAWPVWERFGLIHWVSRGRWGLPSSVPKDRRPYREPLSGEPG